MSFLEQLSFLDKFKLEPKVVVVGGGTGLSTFLSGLKNFTSKITAIVAVTDDGGSSGRLRDDFKILPPGDIRNCLVALSEQEPLMKRLLDYRFLKPLDISGHSFGNLFLTAMTELTGDFVEALKESCRIMAVKGKILPATKESIRLYARLVDKSYVYGESNVNACQAPINRLFLDNKMCEAIPETIEAIKEADLIILGPGSLYTSVLTNLIVPKMAKAIKEAQAPKIYVCNIMTEPNETINYKVSDHLEAIFDHVGDKIVDYVIVNDGHISEDMLKKYAMDNSYPVHLDEEETGYLGVQIRKADLVDRNADFIRHDSINLSLETLSVIGFGSKGKKWSLFNM